MVRLSFSQTRFKAFVWVEFVSPASHAGHRIQLYPKSAEPAKGKAQGADFSLLTALRQQHPNANTWRDLGVAPAKDSELTTATMAVFASYHGGTRWTADSLVNDTDETSDRSPISLAALASENTSSIPHGYTRGMQDPKNLGLQRRIKNSMASVAENVGCESTGPLSLTPTRFSPHASTIRSSARTEILTNAKYGS